MGEASRVLARLNRGSLERTFTPQTDVDWSATTTDEEFAALYPVWSLLQGTGADQAFTRTDRIDFAKYQQMNLMLFTGLFERHAIRELARLHDLSEAEEFQEYVGHFIKEELYHHVLFVRAVRRIHATMGDRPPLPTRRLDGLLRIIFAGLALLPSRRLRAAVTVSLFRFAEQVTMLAHRVARSTIDRRESLVVQVWGYHALDEARHLVFDDLVLQHFGVGPRWRRLPGLLALPLCVVASLALNANELWAARQLGLTIGIWQLPRLMRRTTALFKRRVFGVLGAVMHDPGAPPEPGDTPEAP